MVIQFARSTVQVSVRWVKMAITTVTDAIGVSFAFNIHWPAEIFCHNVALRALYGRITSTLNCGIQSNTGTSQIHDNNFQLPINWQNSIFIVQFFFKMANDELLSFSFNAVLHNYVEDIESTVFEEECACVEFLLNVSPSVDDLGFVWDDEVYAVKKHDVQFRLDKSLMVSYFFFYLHFCNFYHV